MLITPNRVVKMCGLLSKLTLLVLGEWSLTAIVLSQNLVNNIHTPIYSQRVRLALDLPSRAGQSWQRS